MSDERERRFQTGNHVEKVGGDYTFEGEVVAAFRKRSGAMRYVVEDDRGILHIYSNKNLRPAAAESAPLGLLSAAPTSIQTDTTTVRPTQD